MTNDGVVTRAWTCSPPAKDTLVEGRCCNTSDTAWTAPLSPARWRSRYLDMLYRRCISLTYRRSVIAAIFRSCFFFSLRRTSDGFTCSLVFLARRSVSPPSFIWRRRRRKAYITSPLRTPSRTKPGTSSFGSYAGWLPSMPSPTADPAALAFPPYLAGPPPAPRPSLPTTCTPSPGPAFVPREAPSRLEASLYARQALHTGVVCSSAAACL
mmetsp:Transcript_41/g.130  ORF Transcript_41/g.130 Transcript_41/m.130 type:complete len:211 (-) Transcript_41:197-829(-)